MTPSTNPPDSPSELGIAASDLRMATFRLARRLRAQRAVDTMSDGQFAVLAALKSFGPHTLSALATRERVTAPSMNRTVNSLEESGLLTRTPASDDRRKITLEVTAEGRAVVEETARRRDAWLEGALAEVSEEDRATLTRAAELMQRLAER
jgi:DNA-binding MarR family transcriptional regulator